MRICKGYLYHIKNVFFKHITDEMLMVNHNNNHSRPSYYVFSEGKILWFVPLSSQVEKYKRIRDYKIKRYGKCKTIIIKKIDNIYEVFLLQNAFPTLKKYVKSIHTINKRRVVIPQNTQKEIENNLKYLLFLKEKGKNLFFTDIDKITDRLMSKR